MPAELTVEYSTVSCEANAKALNLVSRLFMNGRYFLESLQSKFARPIEEEMQLGTEEDKAERDNSVFFEIYKRDVSANELKNPSVLKRVHEGLRNNIFAKQFDLRGDYVIYLANKDRPSSDGSEHGSARQTKPHDVPPFFALCRGLRDVYRRELKEDPIALYNTNKLFMEGTIAAQHVMSEEPDDMVYYRPKPIDWR